MQKLSLADETFDLNYTLNYNLSIQVSLDGFSFSILDTIQNKVIYLYHQSMFTGKAEFLLKKIKSIYDESDLLELPYKEVKILFLVPDQTTIIPSDYFEESDSLTYFNTLFDADHHSVLLSDRVVRYNQRVIYRIHAGILKFLHEKHPSAKLKNNLTLFSSLFQDCDNTEFTLSIYRKFISILAVDSGKIIFFNSFYCDGENDILYYSLGTLKTIDKIPKKIILSGIVNKHAAIYHRLRQYHEQIVIDEKPAGLHYNDLIDRLPDARFVNLFNSFICE